MNKEVFTLEKKDNSIEELSLDDEEFNYTLDNTLVHENNTKNVMGLLLIGGIILIIFGVVIYFMINEEKEEVVKSEEVVEEVKIDSNSVVKFGGQLYYDPVENIYNTFDIDIPSEFNEVLVGSNNVDYYIETIPNDYYSRCSVELKEVLNYNKAEDLVSGMAVYYGVDEDVVIKNINNIKWYYFKYDGFMNSNVYITEKNNVVYKYEYGCGENTNKDICDLYKDKIINTVKFK